MTSVHLPSYVSSIKNNNDNNGNNMPMSSMSTTIINNEQVIFNQMKNITIYEINNPNNNNNLNNLNNQHSDNSNNRNNIISPYSILYHSNSSNRNIISDKSRDRYDNSNIIIPIGNIGTATTTHHHHSASNSGDISISVGIGITVGTTGTGGTSSSGDNNGMSTNENSVVYNGIIVLDNDTTYINTVDDHNETLNSFYFYETEQFTVLWILFIMIVMGNSTVLVTLLSNKSRKSRMNFFIKQLAIADLLVGLINVLTDIVWRITVTWYAGNAACKCIRFVQAVVTYASTYVLVALSIDRYDAITHPMNFSGSWRRARVLVGIAWSLSFLFSTPVLFLFEEKPVQGQLQCWIDLSPLQWRVYMTLIAIVLFFIPALVITSCYMAIVQTIWSKSNILMVHPSQQHHQSQQQLEAERALRDDTDDMSECRRASSRGIIPKAKIKTIKMTFVIVFVFVLCWSPYIVFDLLQVYGYIPRTQTNIALATFVQSLAPLNSAANPIIYCLFSTRTCRTLKNLRPFKWLGCCYCWTYYRNLCITNYRTTRLRSHRDLTRTMTTSVTTPNSSTRRTASSSLRQQIRLQNNAAATAARVGCPMITTTTLHQITPRVAISVV